MLTQQLDYSRAARDFARERQERRRRADAHEFATRAQECALTVRGKAAARAAAAPYWIMAIPSWMPVRPCAHCWPARPASWEWGVAERPDWSDRWGRSHAATALCAAHMRAQIGDLRADHERHIIDWGNIPF